MPIIGVTIQTFPYVLDALRKAAAEGARLPFNQRGSAQVDLLKDGKVKASGHLGGAP